MRLGQLARKLSLRPAQIVEFLAKNSIQIEENSNTRLQDSHVEIIVQHFAPENLREITAEVEEMEEAIPTENKEPIVESEATESETVENQDTGEIEVIRAQKIELSGLKVVGKIDLPEPKKKEPVAEQTEESKTTVVPENTPVNPEVRPRNLNRKSIRQNKEHQRSWKNPLELQREREARAAEERKRLDANREKEKRKQHYEERVKSLAQPKRIKPQKEQPEIKKKPVDTRPVPKTWLGKFLRWWTT